MHIIVSFEENNPKYVLALAIILEKFPEATWELDRHQEEKILVKEGDSVVQYDSTDGMSILEEVAVTYNHPTKDVWAIAMRAELTPEEVQRAQIQVQAAPDINALSEFLEGISLCAAIDMARAYLQSEGQ